MKDDSTNNKTNVEAVAKKLLVSMISDAASFAARKMLAEMGPHTYLKVLNTYEEYPDPREFMKQLQKNEGKPYLDELLSFLPKNDIYGILEILTEVCIESFTSTVRLLLPQIREGTKKMVPHIDEIVHLSKCAIH